MGPMPNITIGWRYSRYKTLTPSRQREIFAHGQRVDVADAAVIEIARVGVVQRVTAPPVIVGRQCQHADDAADPVIRRDVAEK